MYDRTDPRSALASASASQAQEFAGADYLKFYQMPPSEQDASASTWYGRGQNFLVAYTKAEPGAVLSRAAQPDEFAILLPDVGTEIVVEAGGQQETIAGGRIVFVPPGSGHVRVVAGGPIVRLFSSRADDIATRCVNAAAYAAPQLNTAPLEPWPVPPDGFKIRSYSLDVPPSPVGSAGSFAARRS